VAEPTKTGKGSRTDGVIQGKCWFFFHDWGKWSTPYIQKIHPIDELGTKIGPIYNRMIQYRYCRRCQKLQIKSVH
jgi:hypothetical protein